MERGNFHDDADEIEKCIAASVIQMRSMLQGEHNITVPNQCDEFLARCFRQKDGKLEDAIRLVRGYHETVPNFKHWDATLSASLSLEVGAGLILPVINRDALGRYVFIVRPGLWDTTKIKFDQAVASMWMTAQYAHSELLDVQKHGYIAVWDFTGISAQQLWAVKLMRTLALVKWAKNGVGGRIKAIHLINHPKTVDKMFKAIKSFLNEKLKKRIILHENVDNLLQHVNRKCLPTSLGGIRDQDLIDEPLLNGFRNSDKYWEDMMKVGFPTK